MTVRNAEVDDIPQIIELAKRFHAISGYDCFELDYDSVERNYLPLSCHCMCVV